MFKEHSIVQQALNQRNKLIAKFWLSEPAERFQFEPALAGRKVVMIDAEDSFAAMFAQQLTAIGMVVTIRKFDASWLVDHHEDLVVMGPGPGNPENIADPRIASMHQIMVNLIAKHVPFLAVCLSHQILCLQLGLKLIRKIPPNQGIQREINYFGQLELVGFYNTYAAQCSKSQAESLNKNRIEVSRDMESGEVYALKGPCFASMQFHAESLLTCNGIDIIASNIKSVLN